MLHALIRRFVDDVWSVSLFAANAMYAVYCATHLDLVGMVSMHICESRKELLKRHEKQQ
jgi:hypothetical protein